MSDRAKIGVVGERDTVLCFKTIGLEVFPTVSEDPEESRRIVDQLAREGYGIIFLTEGIAQTISETIDKYKSRMLPAIILIPGNQGSLGIALQRIRDNVERAVGMNILDGATGGSS